jgi:hypothetical protein
MLKFDNVHYYACDVSFLTKPFVLSDEMYVLHKFTINFIKRKERRWVFCRLHYGVGLHPFQSCTHIA